MMCFLILSKYFAPSVGTWKVFGNQWLTPRRNLSSFSFARRARSVGSLQVCSQAARAVSGPWPVSQRGFHSSRFDFSPHQITKSSKNPGSNNFPCKAASERPVCLVLQLLHSSQGIQRSCASLGVYPKSNFWTWFLSTSVVTSVGLLYCGHGLSRFPVLPVPWALPCALTCVGGRLPAISALSRYVVVRSSQKSTGTHRSRPGLDCLHIWYRGSGALRARSATKAVRACSLKRRTHPGKRLFLSPRTGLVLPMYQTFDFVSTAA